MFQGCGFSHYIRCYEMYRIYEGPVSGSGFRLIGRELFCLTPET